jgi:predicted SnoaL-like aldol condensation-catalyzing enzyme
MNNAVTVPLTEQDIQRGITDLLKQLGFMCYHTWMSKHSAAGFPDVVAVRDDGALVVVECKSAKGRLGMDQMRWIVCFRRTAGCLFADVVGPTETDDWMGYDRALDIIRERGAAMRGAG